jgi:hypothetical protein
MHCQNDHTPDAPQINLKNPWAKVIDTITVKNTGSGPASTVVVCYPGALAARLAINKVHSASSTRQLGRLLQCPAGGAHQVLVRCRTLCADALPPGADTITPPQVLVQKEKQAVARLPSPPAGAPAGTVCFSATLSEPLKKGASLELDAVATFTGVFNPNPSKIQQTETQYVEHTDTLHLLSPYAVKEQTTVVCQRSCWRVCMSLSIGPCAGTRCDSRVLCAQAKLGSDVCNATQRLEQLQLTPATPPATLATAAAAAAATPTAAHRRGCRAPPSCRTQRRRPPKT